MDEIGLVVTGLISILGLIVTFNKLIIHPVNELSKVVERLNVLIDSVTMKQTRLEKRVDLLENNLNTMRHRLERNRID